MLEIKEYVGNKPKVLSNNKNEKVNNVTPKEGDVKMAKCGAVKRKAKQNRNHQNQQIGKVIAVGEGHMLENGTRASLMVKKDDLVIFSKFAGTNITDNDESYLLIEERDILAKIHN